MAPNICPGFFSSCADKFKNMSFDMFWKWLIEEDINGCPAVRVTGTISTTAPTPVTNAQTDEQMWSLGTNALNLAAFQNWKAANGSKSVLSITNLTGNDGVTSLLIQHTL